MFHDSKAIRRPIGAGLYPRSVAGYTDSTVVKLRWLNELCDDFMHLESLGKHYLLQVLAQSRPLS